MGRARAAVPWWPAVLTARELQMPFSQERFLILPSDDAAIIGHQVDLAPLADVRHVGESGAQLARSACHFDHHFRRSPDRATDVCNLLRRESFGRTGATSTHQVEE